jgi:hypothetical protein
VAARGEAQGTSRELLRWEGAVGAGKAGLSEDCGGQETGARGTVG